MTKRSSLVFASLLLLLVASVVQAQATPAADGSIYLFAELRGANEVPANNSTAVGSSLVTIDSNNVVTFEVNIGSVQNATLSHIHEGPPTCACPVVVGFASGASQFSNGRTKGTIQATADVVTRIKANPANFYVNVHSQQFGGGEIRGILQPATEFDIPISGNITSALTGDKFITDARIFNPSSTNKAVVLVEYLITGAGNTNATASKTVEIAPRGEALLDDVTGANNLNSIGSIGALRISSNVPLLTSADIFTDRRGTGKGTFGQFVAGVPRGSALRRGVILHLSNKTFDAANPTGFRTNLGFFNPNQSGVSVNLTLRDASGAVLATNTIGLGGWSQQQTAIGSYFPSVDVSNAPGLTVSFDSSLPIDAYGAVNDNASTDSFVVPAQPDTP